MVLSDYSHPYANDIWLWGQGRSSALPSFKVIYGKDAYLVSAVDIVKGIARLSGVNVVHVEGATGYLDSNFEGKVDAILSSVRDGDVGFIHVEATDETGHEGDPEKKRLAIETFDRRVIGYFLSKLDGDFRILVIPDHPTPCDLRTHVGEPVPFLIYPCICAGRRGHGGKVGCYLCSSKKRFTELDSLSSGIFFDAKRILSFFLSL